MNLNEKYSDILKSFSNDVLVINLIHCYLYGVIFFKMLKSIDYFAIVSIDILCGNTFTINI